MNFQLPISNLPTGRQVSKKIINYEIRHFIRNWVLEIRNLRQCFMRENLGELKKSILSTLVYFNIFDYPLTAWEAWKYLYGVSAEYLDVVLALDELSAQGKIETQKGFYFFNGRQGLCNLRLKRYLIAEKKYKKARRILKIISIMPFVRFIGIINTLSYNNAREESDIDVLVMACPQRLWLVRFFTVSFLRIFGLRPNGQDRSDRICLNFFVSPDGMDFENIALKPKDIHLAHIIMQMVPIYDEQGYSEEFANANIWAREIFPNFFAMRFLPERVVYLGWFGLRVKKVLEFILSLAPKNTFEAVFKKIQMFIMPKILKDCANKDTNVVLNEKLLKFHVNDRREEYNNLWREKIRSY